MFPKIGVPQNGWFIRENPIKNGWFGGPTTIFGNTHIFTIAYIHIHSSESTNHWCSQGAHHQNGADRAPSPNRDRGAWPPGTSNGEMFKKIGGLNHQIQDFPDLLWDEVEFILLMVQISFHQLISLKGVLYVSTLPEFLSWTVFHRPGFLWNKFENSLIFSKLEWGVVWRFYKWPDLCRVLGSVSVHWKFFTMWPFWRHHM